MVARSGRILIARLVKTGTGVSQLVQQGFGGFFKTRALCASAAALEVGGHNNAGDKRADGCKKEGDDTGKHRHLLF